MNDLIKGMVITSIATTSAALLYLLKRNRMATTNLNGQPRESKRIKVFSAIDKLIQTLDDTLVTSQVQEGMMLNTALATHNGHFHCDEALALAMLKILPSNASRSIFRSRDAKLLDQAHTVVDVGAVYDSGKLRFDHHQRGFMETLNEKRKMKLSSAGLVYKHFGKEIITELLKEETITPKEIEVIYDKCYTDFIEHIDGIDNGVQQYENGGEKHYSISTSLSARVGDLNPEWNEPDIQENVRFKEAMKLTGTEFVECILRMAYHWLPARKIVEQAVAKRFEIHPSGKLIKFESGCPYKGHLSDLEDEQGFQATYVISPDSSGSWRIICVNDRGSEFVSRKSLPEKYRGLRDDVLAQVSGIPDAIFVHAAGFIGGVKSYEGALKMAIQALEM